jgi:ATP-binding cassette subfamily B protein/subfamily B ATP-binding cassette protein MsbA
MHSLLGLLPFLLPYRCHAAVVVLCAAGAAATNLAGPWLVRGLVQLLMGTEDGGLGAVTDQVSWLALGLLAAYVSRAVFLFLTGYLAHVVAWGFVRDLTVQLYGHLQRQSLGYHGDRQTGDTLTRLTKDTADMEPFFAHDVPDIITNGVMLVGVTVILFALNPALAALVLLPMPFLSVFVLVSGKRMHEAFRSAHKHYSSLGALLQDNLSGIKEIQAFTREREEHQRVARRARRHLEDRLRANRIEAFYVPGVELLAGAGMVMVVFFGGRAVLAGSMPVGDLVAFVLYLALLYQPLQLLARTSEGYGEAVTSARSLRGLLDARPEVTDPPEAAEPGRLRGAAALEHVDFEYEPGQPVLRDVSLDIEPGQTVALVGPTGAGKSTVASLVPRFYDVRRGRVTVDGVDVREMSLTALRSNVSVVPQDTFLFNGTLRENLRFGNGDASDEDVVRAAKAANAHDFIRKLPEGYDTHIGERGVRLSGGQKQRLSIARALLKDAPILILDEATSAVDTTTEAEIQEALNRLMRGRTAIVIAHRLSTIRNADKIAVLEAGSIVESGNHRELMERGGIYRRLHDQQFATSAP